MYSLLCYLHQCRPAVMNIILTSESSDLILAAENIVKVLYQLVPGIPLALLMNYDLIIQSTLQLQQISCVFWATWES